MSRIRSSFLVGTLSLSALGTLGLSSPAAAQVCDPSTLTCSVDTIKPRVEGNERLPTSIDTGWLPSCDPPTGSGHCGKTLQFRANLALDPIGGGEGSTPVYVVDMPKDATVQAEWPTTDAFVISVKPVSTPSATFRVTHTLTPELGLFLDLPVLGETEFNIDATDLLNKIPGAQFNYAATKSGTFSPWGFEGVTIRVQGTDLDNSRLFTITTEQLGLTDGSSLIEGRISLNATTDTNFVYQTDQIQLIGGIGAITSAAGTAEIPMSDANYLEFSVITHGTLSYAGTLDLRPVIGITSPISVNFPISVGLDFDFSALDIPVTFPTQIVHIPLPNVFVPSSFVDFGQVDTGSKNDKKVVLDNTGELGATLSFESDDPQFSTGGVVTTQIGPQQTYDLTVSFRPTKPGPQKATITVISNDPDSPEQSFEVMGFGQGEALPDPGTGGSGGGNGGSGGGGFAPSGGNTTEDGGCGCSIPQGSSSGSTAGLLGLLGLALLRRRRSARKA